MPRNASIVAPGVPYYVTQRGTNCQKVFFSTADRELYLRLIRERLQAAHVRVLAYCLMPNHVHFVVVPEAEDSLAALFGYANGRYAQAANIRKGRSGHLWQARYYSCALSERHLWAALRYVEANPCRAHLAEHPQAYRWSSGCTHLLGTRDSSGILDLDFWRVCGGAEAWVAMHGAPEAEEEIKRLRNCTYAGRPFGEESFVTAMEERFGRKWRRTASTTLEKIALGG